MVDILLSNRLFLDSFFSSFVLSLLARLLDDVSLINSMSLPLRLGIECLLAAELRRVVAMEFLLEVVLDGRLSIVASDCVIPDVDELDGTGAAD